MTGSVRLSVLIVARNEEQRLPSCLDSAAFADEVVVVLDRSTDASARIAQERGAKVVEGAWPNEGERRNSAIAQCSGDWILELDADEHISPALRDELARTLPQAAPGYFVVPFHNHFCGKFVRHGWGAYNGVPAKSCLFARGMKHWGNGAVHPPIRLSGPRRDMQGHIDHYVDDSLFTMMERLNWYSTGAAADCLARAKIPSRLTTARRIPSRFFRVYIRRQGWREGWRGLAIAMFSGLYPLLTHLKILEIQSREEKANVQ